MLSFEISKHHVIQNYFLPQIWEWQWVVQLPNQNPKQVFDVDWIIQLNLNYSKMGKISWRDQTVYSENCKTLELMKLYMGSKIKV